MTLASPLEHVMKYDLVGKGVKFTEQCFLSQINHTKSAAFWIGGKKEIRTTWNDEFKWTLAPHEAISKLCGTSSSFP
jgi:hypothetical protein